MDRSKYNTNDVISFNGKRVLVTGGGGFIGGELVGAVLQRDADLVRVLENDEQSVFETRQRFSEHEDRLQFFFGDLRDAERVRMAMTDVDVVFHAGALKHVDLSEYNPFETVMTNVNGSQNLIRAAVVEGVESFTAISTDKASNPSSVMGATKFLMERLVVGANLFANGTDFNCVRLGNVLGSSGSVVPIFLEQIRSGGPITVTDPEMTRFVLPVERAIELILDGHGRMAAGQVAVLKMPTFEVGDLAEALCEAYAPRFGHDPGDVDIEVTGKRPGERVHEKLISRDELELAHEFEDMFVIYPPMYVDRADVADEVTNDLDGEFASDDGQPLSKDELVAMVEQAHVPALSEVPDPSSGPVRVSGND